MQEIYQASWFPTPNEKIGGFDGGKSEDLGGR
jgi:hypothetical protein